MVGVALLGAGIFAREEHLPAIEAAGNLKLLAVYSRSRASVDALASEAKSPVDKYYDTPNEPGKSLDDLLARSDIDAVIVVLPINSQPAVIKKALEARKHVLSEKPVAKDVATAKELISWYRSLADPPIWAVAENFRYLKGLTYAVEKVKQVGGKLATFHLQQHSFVKPDNKYLLTEWRKVPEHQGGFLLDAGVHFIAGLRLMLGAVGEEVTQVASLSNLLQERLPPVDTVHSVAATSGGLSGTIVMSHGVEFKSGLEIEVVTTNGAVRWTPTQVQVTKQGAEKETTAFERESGVKAEVAAFGKSVESLKIDPLQTPEQAYKDLEILQGLLESGEAKASLKTFN